MKQLMPFKNLTFSLLLTAITIPAIASTVISPADIKLQYTGRIDFANPAAPQISWPGTSISANFTGQYVAVTLDDQ